MNLGMWPAIIQEIRKSHQSIYFLISEMKMYYEKKIFRYHVFFYASHANKEKKAIQTLIMQKPKSFKSIQTHTHTYKAKHFQ